MMAYPKNDNKFTDFTVEKVFEKGDEWIIHSSSVLDDYPVSKKLFPNGIKIGAKCRVYLTADMNRGLYVSGKIVRAYKTQEQLARWRKDFTHKRSRGIARAFTKSGIREQIQKTCSRRDGEVT